ncbi:MAG: methyltransferase domain-containing protein [Gammaproteobacteria bacterium]
MIREPLFKLLACPRHHQPLAARDAQLVCAAGCAFPVVDGVPVLLLEEAPQTIGLAHASLRQARGARDADGLYLDSLGISESQKDEARRLAAQSGSVDAVVSCLIAATNGLAYREQVGRLSEYPIPQLPLPRGDGQLLLDVGCSWGRWCVAAARKGYRVVGIDPSLGAVMAARRVARQLGVEADFIAGDARFLPLLPSSVDRVFSYSVLQHFGRADAAQAVAEIGRVLKHGGTSTVQMPTRFGLRCLFHQLRRGFREGRDFEVRYWTLPALRRLFAAGIGPAQFDVDCYFGIGLQYPDRRFMTPPMRVVVALSEVLRRASRWLRPLLWVADSVYVRAGRSRIGRPSAASANSSSIAGASDPPLP